jgi:hypothetical protein
MDDLRELGMREPERLPIQDQNGLYRRMLQTFVEDTFANHTGGAGDDDTQSVIAHLMKLSQKFTSRRP